MEIVTVKVIQKDGFSFEETVQISGIGDYIKNLFREYSVKKVEILDLSDPK